MVVRFTWQADEWKEAYLLCRAKQAQSGHSVSIEYLVLATMLAGGCIDLLHSLHHSHELLHEHLSVALVLVVCFVASVHAGLAFVRFRKRFRELPTRPEGEQRVIVHEGGWDAADEPAEEAERIVRPWSEFKGHRTGRSVLAFITSEQQIAGVPLRVLSAHQHGWLEDLLERKRVPMAPSPIETLKFSRQ